MIFLYILIAIILFITVYFIQPYSALKSDFNTAVDKSINNIQPEDEVFTEEDIKNLPAPVQKYFRYCGYIGKPKMSYMKIVFKDVDFSTGVGKPNLKIDYTQYNFIDKPERFAFIDSSMFGIPFQGFDSYNNGAGGMKGVIAKAFTLFDQRSEDMDKACLATFLSESLIIPSVAIQDYIVWESVDDTHARATITYNGISASGIFTFNDQGEMLLFTTGDRTAVDFEGNSRKAEWSAICGNYKDNNGIMQPTVLQAIWHYPEGDHLYFDGSNVEIQYDTK